MRHGGDAGAGMHGDAMRLSARQLDFPRVQSGPDLEAERAHRVADAAGAADRASRSVERREEAITGRVDLAPTECAQLTTHDS